MLSRDTRKWHGASDAIETVVRDTGWLTRGFRLGGLTRAIEQSNPDIVYARFDTGSLAMASMMRRIPTVLELNTDDLAEYRTYLPSYQYGYHRVMRKGTLSQAAGFVAVTHELADRFASFGHPTKVIANGIDLSEYAPLPPSKGKGLRFVFMGSPGAKWHGVDKIAELAASLPDIAFDLIGPSPSDALPKNVVAHGMLSSGEYHQVLAKSDVAIGTLAMHRNNMGEGSTLKVREYLALGLPCVIGHRDTDFPEAVPFILRLPNTEDNVSSNAERIREFCQSWHGRRVDRDSVAHLDVRKKEAQRLAFMSSLL